MPSPPPLALWDKVDNGVVIALDIAFATYATYQQYFKLAFAAAVSDALGLSQYTVSVTDFQSSLAGTVLLYFDILLQGTDDDTRSNLQEVYGLFNSTSDLCRFEGSVFGVGCPSLPLLTSSLQKFGLPVAAPGAYFNQQFP